MPLSTRKKGDKDVGTLGIRGDSKDVKIFRVQNIKTPTEVEACEVRCGESPREHEAPSDPLGVGSDQLRFSGPLLSLLVVNSGAAMVPPASTMAWRANLPVAPVFAVT